ncbi:hypothetical protein C8J56DRAFT_906880 [Mycena floridula]|nr:hypothetical protein C8J56DRAFT_906880 [Mycena floridula]
MSDKADSGKISRKQTTVNQLAKLGDKNELQNTFAKQTKRRKARKWNPLEGAGHVGRNCKFLGPKIRENKTNPEEAGGEMCESKHREHTVAREVWASASKLWSLDITPYLSFHFHFHFQTGRNSGAFEIWTPISLAIGSLVTRVIEVSQAELEPSYPNGTDDFYHRDADMQKGSPASVYFNILLFRVNSKTDFPVFSSGFNLKEAIRRIRDPYRSQRRVWLIAEQDDMILEIKRLGRMPQNQEQVALRKVVKHSWSAIMNRVITLGGLKNILRRPLSYFHVDESEVLDEEQDPDDFVGYTIPDDDDDDPSDDGEAEKDDQNTASDAQIESADDDDDDDDKFTVDTVTDTSIIDLTLTDDDDDQVPNKSTRKRRRAKALTVTSDDEEEVIVISDDEEPLKRRKTD